MTQIGNAIATTDIYIYISYGMYVRKKRKLQRRAVDANWIPLT